jgi:Flp pilus assembly protein TadG
MSGPLSGPRDLGPKTAPRAFPARLRGSAIIFVAVAIATCLAFSVLAIDVGLIVLTRVQLQNAADAGALAGASALLDGDQTAATARAIAVSGQNVAWQDGPQPVVITDGDVTFPNARRCRVQTHRTRATGDALSTYFIRVINPTADRLAQVTAMAEAEYYFVCSTDCVKPWSMPDRWNDVNGNGEYDNAEPYTDVNGNGQWDPGEPYTDENGNGAWDPDEPYDPMGTGYLPPGDIGLRITLKLGSPHDAITPGFFYAVDLPPLHSPYGPPQTGGSQYRWNIANCSPYDIGAGDSLQVEPGNMVGPTIQGARDLIDLDPLAYWDDGSQSIMGSDYGTSPRVIKIGFFDPRYTPRSGRTYVIVSKLGAFFIESVAGNGQVNGVYMDLATVGEECDPSQQGLLTALRLIQ